MILLFISLARCAQEFAFMMEEEKLNYLLTESKKEKKIPKTFASNRNLLHALENYSNGSFYQTPQREVVISAFLPAFAFLCKMSFNNSFFCKKLLVFEKIMALEGGKMFCLAMHFKTSSFGLVRLKFYEGNKNYFYIISAILHYLTLPNFTAMKLTGKVFLYIPRCIS